MLGGGRAESRWEVGGKGYKAEPGSVRHKLRSTGDGKIKGKDER